MKKILYVYLMQKLKSLDVAVIERHQAHLKWLDESGNLVLCGPFTDFPGGMVVVRASSYEEAQGIAESDPFIAEGYESYSLRTLEVCRRLNWLLRGRSSPSEPANLAS